MSTDMMLASLMALPFVLNAIASVRLSLRGGR
jgi:hypothetical protein